MKPLVLHIGLHKTATTALQDFLKAQLPALEARGATYVPLGAMRKRFTPGLQKIGPDTLADLGAFLAKRPEQAVVLSDENIAGIPREALRDRLYARAGARVRAILAAARPRPATVVVTLREPGPFLVSLYCEYLRHNPFLAFADYTQAMDLEGFSFAGRFRWVRAHDLGATAVVLPFEETRGGGLRAVADAVLTAACGPGHGVDLGALPTARSRATFSAEEIALFADVAARAGPAVAHDVVGSLERHGARFGATRYAPLPEATTARLRARYEADLTALGAAALCESAS